MENLKEIVIWLVDNNYVVLHKNRYLFTTKFNQEMIGQDIGIKVVEHPVVQQEATKVAKTVDKTDWIALYQKLLMEAGVPAMSDNGRGGQYRVNTATKPGREAFKKAIQEGETYESLLGKLKNYYGTTRSYQIKVEKFFVDEVWRSVTINQSSGTINRPKLF